MSVASSGQSSRRRGSALVRESIREEIVGGRLPPGSSLPPQLELARRFGVSNITVQQALSQLAGQGFLDVRPRVGTFVAVRPPHLNNYALVFCADPASPPPRSGRPWTRHYLALANEATRIQQQTGKRLHAFHGVDEHVDGEDSRRLLGYIETQRLAGIIFVTAPFLLHGSPILERPGLPRIAIASRPEPGVEMAALNHDTAEWYRRALDWLAERGCRRVATLGLSSATRGNQAFDETWLPPLLAERGMETRPRWRQLASIRNPDTARLIAELLMHDAERPDALLVNDDNFVEPALAGVAAAGVRVPEELAVVAHANFPWTPSLALPARLLGYDTGEVLGTCLDYIDRRRRGEDLARCRVVKPLWQEEYPAAARVPTTVAGPAMAETTA